MSDQEPAQFSLLTIHAIARQAGDTDNTGLELDAIAKMINQGDEQMNSTSRVGSTLFCFVENADTGYYSACLVRRLFTSHHQNVRPFRLRILLDCPPVNRDIASWSEKRVVAELRRLVRQLPDDEILVTERAMAGMSNDATGSLMSFETASLARPCPHPLFQVVVQEAAATRLSIATKKDARQDDNKSLHLRWRDRKLTLHPDSPAITLGRTDGTDIQLDSELASRLHASLNYSRSDFVLTDQSTNGTYIKIDNDEEICLHGEQISLRGRGVISLGSRIVSGRGNLVYFNVE